MAAFDTVTALIESKTGYPGRGGSYRCPAHDDQSPSLSVSNGGGKVVLHCHAGCSVNDICAALGIPLTALFDPKESNGKGDFGELIATYDYTDETGLRLLFQVCRYSPKTFRQRRPDGYGGWIWKLDRTRRVLYRLPQVVEAVASGTTIFIAEGEKDVHALEVAGEVATCNPTGAGKWRPEFTEALHRASKVIIIADADKAGRAHALQVRDSLEGHVGHVLIVEAKVGKDAADHLAAGRAVNDLHVTFDSDAPIPSESPATAQPRSTGVLLRAVQVTLKRYIVFTTPAQATACALWVMHTYVFGVFETTPYLSITSTVKRCGKSRLLELLTLLVARPWYVTEPTEATLFRKVEKDRPCLLVDEVDATFGKDSAVTEGLRAIYNAGYRQGATVPRCVGNTHEVRDFAVFCPKAFAGIKSLPDTVADRSVPVVLRRRARSERKPERFRLGKTRAALAPLAEALDAWGSAHSNALAEAEPALPDELSDRAQDAWEPLLAIGDLAGARWAGRARRAAIELHRDVEDQDLGVMLLLHCRDAFDGQDKMSTSDLLTHLVNRGDDSIWAKWWSKDIDEGKTKSPASRLAYLLKPFDVHPKEVWIAGNKTRGYEFKTFVPAWERYCPTDPDTSPTDPQNGRTVDRRSEAISDTPTADPETCPDQDSTVLPFQQTVGDGSETVEVCVRCSNPEVYLVSYDGRPLCRECVQQVAQEMEP